MVIEEYFDEPIQQKLELLNRFIEQREYLIALQLCDEIIAIDDTLYNVYSERSYIFYQLGKKSQAFLDLQILIELRPWSPSAYLRRSVWNLELGYDNLAIDDLTIVINSQDSYFLETAYFYRAIAYLNTNKSEEAMQDCLKLPDDFSFYVNTLIHGGRIVSRDDILILIETQINGVRVK